MKNILSIVHPWLFAAFPVLFLYGQNQNEIGPGEIVRPLIVVVVSTAVLLVGLNLVLHDPRRAGLVTSVLLLLFFSYGHVWQLFSERAIGRVYIDKDLYLLLPWAVISIALARVAVAHRKYLREITVIANAVALVLVAGPAFSIANGNASTVSRDAACPPRLSADPAAVRARGGHRPDIYYLVFDRYAPSATLQRRFQYDNSTFLDRLRSRGFYVAEQSFANYPRTVHSLASSLNAEFLGCLTEKAGPSNESLGPVFSALEDHAIGRFLQSVGYTYFHLGSWFDATAKSPIADHNISYETSWGFSRMLYSTTLARPFGEMLRLSDSYRTSTAKRARFQFDKLEDLGAVRGPKFVLAHLLLPHEPYVFSKDGRIISASEEHRKGLKAAYTDQLQFTNAKIEQLVRALTSGPVATQPVIVLQSDEGPHPLRFDSEGRKFDWSTAAPDELADTLHILNAVYLPGKGQADLSQTMTPVNTFRRIFNLYLGTDLPLLPDKTYVYKDERHPYVFADVTERVRRVR